MTMGRTFAAAGFQPTTQRRFMSIVLINSAHFPVSMGRVLRVPLVRRKHKERQVALLSDIESRKRH